MEIGGATGRLSSTEIQTGITSVNSAPEEQSSIRCDLQGILAWLSMVEKLLGRIVRGSIGAGFDSDVVLKGIIKLL